MNLTSPTQVKSWCIENGFHPNRTLGQNFLIDRNTLDAIIAASGVGDIVNKIKICANSSDGIPAVERKRQRVLEIGPGLGVLTEALLQAEASVTAVEKDSRLAARLADALGNPPTLHVITADALELPLDDLLSPPFDCCVSNLPYSVGTRILLDIARHPAAPRSITVLVQTEVAERFAALEDGGEARGLAGVWLQRDYGVTLVREVKASCFWPRPEVGSTLVRLERKPCPLAADERHCFESLTRQAFMHRRKQLGAALRKTWSDEALVRAFEAAGVDAKSRAGTVTNGQWVKLAQELAK